MCLAISALPLTVSFPRRRESSMLDAVALSVMRPLVRRMLDPRLRGDDTECGGRYARVTEVHDLRADQRTHKARNSTPETRWFAFRTPSVTVHLFPNPFRRLSEICTHLSPHIAADVDSTPSPHRKRGCKRAAGAARLGGSDVGSIQAKPGRFDGRR